MDAGVLVDEDGVADGVAFEAVIVAEVAGGETFSAVGARASTSCHETGGFSRRG